MRWACCRVHFGTQLLRHRRVDVTSSHLKLDKRRYGNRSLKVYQSCCDKDILLWVVRITVRSRISDLTGLSQNTTIVSVHIFDAINFLARSID